MTPSEEIKQRLDIVDLIGSSGVQLRKAGRNFTGFCPFHPNTRTPAFYVFPDTQSYYCFSCHKSGDAFTFTMERQGLPFGEALEQLAQRAGVQLPERTPDMREAQEQENALQARLRQINEDSAVYWNYVLNSAAKGAAGRAYAEKRGLGAAAIEAWQLGFAPDDWTDLLRYLTDRKGYTAEELEQAGLVIKRESGGYYDRFRNRLMFPIRDLKGTIVGFGGRAIGDDHAKYMNTPETALFHKSSLLFGLHQAREGIRSSDRVVIVEGYLDVITAHQAGFGNVVAPMGTALTAEQVQVVRKLTTNIYLALDADAAGVRAAEKGLQSILQTSERQLVQLGRFTQEWEVDFDLPVKIIQLPAGSDPDDIIRADPQRWRDLVAAALPIVDFFFALYSRGVNLRDPEEQQRALARLAPIVARIKDFAKRAVYENRLAEILQMPFALIQSSVVESSRQLRQRVPGVPHQGRSEPAPAVPTHDPRAHEDQLLSLLLRFPQVRERVEATLSSELDAFPDLRAAIPTELCDAFSRTENRLVWNAWRDHGPNGPSDRDAWLGALDPVLQPHVRKLLQWKDDPPLGTFELVEARDRAAGIAQRLRREIAQRRSNEIGSMTRSIEDETTWAGLARAVQLVLDYRNVVTAPRRSTVFSDLRDKRV